ncbi:hypothetical protein [Ensifer soli]|uniref:hypothetical protein n=1 Tax=Ciceribacter sp. sgz301302 TaxID=3342379 RepID=UPI0035BA31B7
MVTLTSIQVKGLKLSKNGDLFFQGAKRWTHENATITYSKSDRFKERPIKVKFLMTATIDELREYGLIKRIDPDSAESPYRITMAGKMWLLRNK